MAEDRFRSRTEQPAEARHRSPGEERWEAGTLRAALAKSPERPIGAATGINLDEQGKARFTTISGTEVRRIYTEADLPEGLDEALPGEPPYTRGIHPLGYRGKLWTMRQFSGFASAEETN